MKSALLPLGIFRRILRVMGSAAVQPSVAVGRLLRQKRQEMRLTLREVSERLGGRGQRIPASTLARLEQGKLDPGVRRLHLLLDFYRVPPHLVADLIELENLAIEPPAETDLETLYRRGTQYWREGKIPEGLAYLFAVRQRVPDGDDARVLRQKATLGFAVAARNLGKYKLARQLVDDLLCEPPDPAILPRVLVLASSLWRGLGSMDVALALVRQAAATVDPTDDREVGWVRHQEAKLLIEAGHLDAGAEALRDALARYRRCGDSLGQGRAMLLDLRLAERRGDLASAIQRARALREFSERNGHGAVAISATLEWGRLLVQIGEVAGGLDQLRRGLSQAVLSNDQSLEFTAHYQLWKTYGILDDADRARLELEAAEYFVQFTDDHSPEADEVRALRREGARQ